MTRAELELQCIRTSIEAYEQILKANVELTEKDKKLIQEKITGLGEIRDKILSETNNYGL